jgi:hypothetical protein
LNVGSAAKLTTARNIDGQSFDGTANITVIAPGTHAATSKSTPVDADELPLVDSAASNVLKKLTWANLKAALKTYFDGLYAPLPPAWTTYTPTVTAGSGTLTSASATGAYLQMGKIVFFRQSITLTTIGTAGFDVEATLPVPVVGSTVCSGKYVNVGKTLQVEATGSGTGRTFSRLYDGSFPFTDGAILVVSGFYERP